MINLNNQEKSKKFNILLQVHDELLFEVPEKDITNTISIIKPIMENSHLPIKNLNVKLKVDYGYGNNWADAH